MSITYPNTVNLATDAVAETLEADIVIVGSGAGGGIAAEILSASGLKVIIIEEGPLRTGSDFSLREKQAYADLYQEVAGRQTVDKSIQILQGRCVGGSTTVNWTSSFRTPKQTLEFWQDEYLLRGMTREALEPWFDWVEKRLNIAPWAVPPNTNNQLLADGIERLGWKFDVVSRNVNGCANLGYCGMGCPINAKQSMLVSCIPSALAMGAQLISRARVERLVIESDQVKGVVISSLNSEGQLKTQDVLTVKASHIILAAGAIGSPAILLRSGLQDVTPQLGARTFLHPVTATIAKMPFAVNAYQGAPQSVYSDQFLWRDGVDGELGYKIEVPPLHPLLAASMLKKHGAEHARLMQDFSHYQSVIALLRDGFHADSEGGQVSLDEYGFPQLDYQHSDVLWRGFRHAMLTNAEIQFAAGAENVMPLHMDAKQYRSWSQAKKAIETLPAQITRWQIMSAHVMGGCAFGESKARTVCDSKGSFRGLGHLSIFDGSLFPTSLGVNPQMSIYAIVAKLTTELALKLQAKVPTDLIQLTQIEVTA